MIMVTAARNIGENSAIPIEPLEADCHNPYSYHKINQVISMDERAIFDEKQEMKQASFSCSYCGQRDMYDVRWLKRTKKKLNTRNLNERDRMQYEKSRD